MSVAIERDDMAQRTRRRITRRLMPFLVPALRVQTTSTASTSVTPRCR